MAKQKRTDEQSDDFQNYFSERLTKLRMAKGISSRKMSIQMGQSEGYWAQVERKYSLPSLLMFSYLCEFLGITPRDFFDDEIENPGLLQEIISRMKSFNQEELESVLSVVEVIGKKKA